jgi:hypothetical protein
MTRTSILIVLSLIAVAFVGCGGDGGADVNDGEADFSGTYCLNIESLEMTIVQTGNSVTFEFDPPAATAGTGTVHGDTLELTALAPEGTFTCTAVFADNRESFSGPYEVVDSTSATVLDGTLIGTRGQCPAYDIDANGVPRFVATDYTDITHVESISKFRSASGHSYTDEFETCRSMKHYYGAYEPYRENNTFPIYSPVDGIISALSNDGHGASIGLNNKQLRIKSDDQPAFTFIVFHCDLISSAVVLGKQVQAGELIGHARLYYDDLDEHAGCFDIAVSVNTPSGVRLISYFETLDDAVFAAYAARGATSREDFIITRDARDADPLECDGEAFLTEGSLENWVVLH